MNILTNNAIRMTVNFSKTIHNIHCLNAYNQTKFRWFQLGVPLHKDKKHNSPCEKLEVKPTTEDADAVWVGPAHPVSKLRLKVFPDNAKLTKEEKVFYMECKEIEKWNQHYWEAHNKDFKESRNLFIDKVSKEKNISRDEVTESEEMAHFYQHFLKKNHSKHIAYNWNWYKKNLDLLYLGAKVNLTKLKRIFF